MCRGACDWIMCGNSLCKSESIVGEMDLFWSRGHWGFLSTSLNHCMWCLTACWTVSQMLTLLNLQQVTNRCDITISLYCKPAVAVLSLDDDILIKISGVLLTDELQETFEGFFFDSSLPMVVMISHKPTKTLRARCSPFLCFNLWVNYIFPSG